MLLSRSELEKRIRDYMQKYRQEYANISNETTDFLEMSLDSWIDQNYQKAYFDPKGDESFFNQIFVAIDALPEERNSYYQMAKKIENEYGLDRNIVEVGGGLFPALAFEIAKRQQITGKGTITVYDPNMVVTNLDGIKIVKDYFTENCQLEEGSLLVARKPCEASETVIRTANKYKVEFYLNLCCCAHTPEEYALKHKNVNWRVVWQSYIEDLAMSTLPDDFRLERVDELNTCTNRNEVIFKTKIKKK